MNANNEKDLVAAYRKTNRAPRPPTSQQLQHYAQRQAQHDANTSPNVKDDNNSDDDSDKEESPRIKKKRLPRTIRDPAPKNLSFYPRDWQIVLKHAQERFIYYIATQNAFPDCSTDLGNAEEILNHIMADYEDQIGPLQDGTYPCSIFFRIITQYWYVSRLSCRSWNVQSRKLSLLLLPASIY